MSNSAKTMPIILALMLVYSGCATKMRVYPVASSTTGSSQPTRQGGIPFYAPKPVLKVNEPIEVKRAESLYALISLGGLQLFLFKIDMSNYTDSTDRLRELLSLQSTDPVMFVPAPEELSILTKTDKKTDESTKLTKAEHDINEKTVKNDNLTERAAITPQTPATESDIYLSKDASKAYEVLFIPDYSKEYELVINPSKLASSKITITLSNGMLTGLGVETGENKIVESLTDAVKTILTTTADIKKSEIAKAQAIELEKLKSSTSPPAATPQSADEPRQIQVKIVGYVKEVKSSVLKPGLYDISKVLISNEFILPTQEAIYWKRVIF